MGRSPTEEDLNNAMNRMLNPDQTDEQLARSLEYGTRILLADLKALKRRSPRARNRRA